MSGKPAARVGDKGRHSKEDLIAVQGSPDVFINGQAAVRKGDVYVSEPHPASQGSATVNINGKPAVRVGDLLAGHARASSGSPDVFIGDESYGADGRKPRAVYQIQLSQVPGSSDADHVYDNYPFKLFLNDALVQEGMTDEEGLISFEYEPPLMGRLKVVMGNGDELEGDVAALAPGATRLGILQRVTALGFTPDPDAARGQAMALQQLNGREIVRPVEGVLEEMSDYVKAKMP